MKLGDNGEAFFVQELEVQNVSRWHTSEEYMFVLLCVLGESSTLLFT